MRSIYECLEDKKDTDFGDDIVIFKKGCTYELKDYKNQGLCLIGENGWAYADYHLKHADSFKLICSTEGKKDDEDKLDTLLLYKDLVYPLTRVNEVLDYGAAKYEARNWRKISIKRYEAAMMRHISEYFKDTEAPYDEESGFHHLAHAVCCMLFILEGYEY